MNFTEFTAKTSSDAIKEGLKQLGLEESQAVIEIVEQGGFFKRAKVRIAKKEEGQVALKYIEELLEKMGLDGCIVELNEDEEKSVINIISVDSGNIIGHRGEVLDAIQYLASVFANQGNDTFKRIVVDCENYRERRLETLKELGKKMADKAVEKGRKVKLEPMNPYERRIIHASLTEDTRVTTASEGEDPFRFLVITPKNIKPFQTRRDFGRGGNGGGYKKDFGSGSPNRSGFSRDRDRDRRDDSRSQSPRPKKSTVTDFSSFGYLGKKED